MGKYFEKQSVLAIIETFGDDDIYKAVSALTEYNDDANHTAYGEWEDLDSWQVFSPSVTVNNNEYVFQMRKIYLHQAHCSNCHCLVTIDDYDNYCPRCGAKMSYKE